MRELQSYYQSFDIPQTEVKLYFECLSLNGPHVPMGGSNVTNFILQRQRPINEHLPLRLRPIVSLHGTDDANVDTH